MSEATEAWDKHRKATKTRSDKAREFFLAGYKAGLHQSAERLLQIIDERRGLKGKKRKKKR